MQESGISPLRMLCLAAFMAQVLQEIFNKSVHKADLIGLELCVKRLPLGAKNPPSLVSDGGY